MMMWRWTMDEGRILLFARKWMSSPDSIFFAGQFNWRISINIADDELGADGRHESLVVLFVHRPSLGHSPVLVAHFMLHIYRSLSPMGNCWTLLCQQQHWPPTIELNRERKKERIVGRVIARLRQQSWTEGLCQSTPEDMTHNMMIGILALPGDDKTLI